MASFEKEETPVFKKPRISKDITLLHSKMKYVWDPFTDDQHKEWDNTLSAMGIFRKELSIGPALLLSTIVNFCGVLNSAYGDREKCNELLKKYPSILEELEKAREVKSYKSIRILEILQNGYKEDETQLSPTINRRKSTAEKAWKVPYVGRASTLLHRYLDNMNRDRRDKLYQNTATIVQSSGTGKSRTVDHLAQSLFTLPFCLRNPADASGYPPADTEVRKFFTATKDEVKETHDNLKRRLLQFFAHLFRLTRDWITQRDEPYQKLAEYWYEELSNSEFRESLYSAAIKKARNTPISFDLKDTVKFARDGAKQLLSLLEDRAEMVQSEWKAEKPVRLFIYFDESHDMTKDEVYAEELGVKVLRTGYMTLLSALNEFKAENIFSMLLSTNPDLPRYNSSPEYLSSSLGTTLELQAPFTEMPFDQWEQKFIVEENKYTLEEVTQAEFMVRFGRPLFWTRWKVGNDFEKTTIVNFARSKLKVAAGDGDPDGIYDLTALSLRLLLEFEPKRQKSSYLQDQMVAGHMRIALTAPSHREYIRSAAPSEPILAEAAAYIMTEEKLKRPFRTLMKFVYDDLIRAGERGELAARVLLILAHDAAVQNLTSEIRCGIKFSRPILLLDFFSSLFHPPWIEMILQCHAENVYGSPTLKEAFEGAKVHFTHFGETKSPKMLSDEAAWIAMSRGMAWQFHKQKLAVDIGIPILLWDSTLGRYVVTILIIQVNNRREDRSLTIDLEDPECCFFTKHPTNVMYNTRPYITLSLQLGVQTKPSVSTGATAPLQQPAKVESGRGIGKESLSRTNTYDTEVDATNDAQNINEDTASVAIKRSHPRYSIKVLGCSSSVFKVIESFEEEHYAHLASHDFLTEHPRQEPDFLDAVRNFKAIWQDKEFTSQWCEAEHEGTDSS